MIFQERINQLQDDIWSLKKLLVITSMVSGSGFNRELVKVIVRYKVYLLARLMSYLDSRCYYQN